MEKQQTLVLQQVADIIAEIHDRTGEFPSFRSILIHLEKEGLVAEDSAEFVPSDHFLTVEEFRDHIYTAHIPITPIRRDMRQVHIMETGLFPAGKDIFSTVSIPFSYVREHYHDYVEINYVLSGNGILQLDGSKKELINGVFFIIPPSIPHYVSAGRDSVLININIRMNAFCKHFFWISENEDELGWFFRSAILDNRVSGCITYLTGECDITRKLAQTVYDESVLNKETGQTVAINMMSAMLCYINREFKKTTEVWTGKEHEEDSLSSDKLKLHTHGRDIFTVMLNYVQENFATVTLVDVSERFHYSKAYISKLFKKKTGKTYAEIVLDLRLSYACEKIAGSSINISTIAQLAGYSSAECLTHAFKNRYGITPQEYRNGKR